MPAPLPRRHFLQTALATTAAACLPGPSRAAASDRFSFVLLGDLHFDKLEHHDLAWIEKHKGGDLGQIRNYSKLTVEIMPQLFGTLRDVIVEAQRTPGHEIDFVLQVGDLVEGLCGTEELAARQNREAVDFVAAAGLDVPFVFTKGNHDVTGDGAPAAFDQVLLPFQKQQAAKFTSTIERAGANYAFTHGGAEFFFFDAYVPDSLDWLEAALAKRSAKQAFVVIHPPVVPYGARATWHLYASPKDAARRAKLLTLLGQQHAFVLGGHIHRFNSLARLTENQGRFAQLAVSSVINKATPAAKDELLGVAEYTGDQIRVEPRFSPETEPQRRAVYDAERPFVPEFEYADLPGYAVVTVDGGSVVARIYAGTSRQLWRTVDLAAVLHA